jgi:ligand-binding SRPBCC domain-containing protein
MGRGVAKGMKVRYFQSELWLPRPREEVFAFFSDARNLDAITPPWVRFQTLTPAPIEMKAGALIDYKLRVHGFPIRWRTRITEWEPPFRFVDEQLRGPYRLWVHEHEFEPRDGGTLMRDHVRYAVPFDFLVHRLFVRRDVERIFAYRTESLRERFGASGVDLSANAFKLRS